jgi:hypothetical protein
MARNHLRRTLFGLAFLAVSSAQAHKHLDCGAESQKSGAKLIIENGVPYATAARFLYRLTPTNHVTLGPIYRSGTATGEDPDVDNNPLFTSLPVEPDNGGPHDFAAQPGARLAMRVVRVAGPSGGTFSFWDSDGESNSEQITFSVPVGTTNGTQQFLLSENDGSPGSDPYGHIHGRRFSVDRPGLYTVSFRIVDISTNGPEGGPLHAPSDIIPMYFQAGTSIAGFALKPEGAALTFGTETLRTYHVESSPLLGPDAVWTPVAGPIDGDGHLQTIEAVPATNSPTFYRLRVTGP